MKHVMKISTVAFHAIWGKKELNLQRMLDYIELAAGEAPTWWSFRRWR